MYFSLLVEASTVFAQDRVHLHLLHLQLVFMVLQMGLVKGFFSHFSPSHKKSAALGSHSGSQLLPESSPSTPAAHVDTWVDGDEVWIRIDSVHGPFWKRLLSDPRSVAAAVGTALMAAWWLRGCWCGSLLVAERQERSWLVRSSPGLPSHTVAWSSRWCRLCTGAACQSWRLVEEFPVLCGRLVAQFSLGICALFPCPCIW